MPSIIPNLPLPKRLDESFEDIADKNISDDARNYP